MKKLILIAALLLAGCDAYTDDVSGRYELPKGLKDCEVYRMTASRGKDLYVVRCPNSTTGVSYTENKNTVSTTTISE